MEQTAFGISQTIAFVLLNYNAVIITDVMLKRSKDGQQKKSNNQERNEKTALHQELIEKVPNDPLSKKP